MMANKPAVTSAPLRVRCRQCARVRHDLCEGRESGCRCTACPGRYKEITHDASLRHHDPLVQELLALLSQRQLHRYRIASFPAVPAGRCPVCGKLVIQSSFGRRKVTCSPAHRTALWRIRRKAAGEPPQTPQRKEPQQDQELAGRPPGPSAMPEPAGRSGSPGALPGSSQGPVPEFMTPAGSVLEQYLRTGRSW